MKLVVGALSTWSMRAWMCLRMAELPFEEIIIPLDTPGYKETLARYSESMLVPVLDTGDVKIHDSLAIAEYCNELSGGKLLPSDRSKRAYCRSLISELHSGYTNIRGQCPFAWDPKPLREVDCAMKADLERLEIIWACAEGTYYFASPTIVDAFHAVLAYRLAVYGIWLPGNAGGYQERILEWPIFAEALARARYWAHSPNHSSSCL